LLRRGIWGQPAKPANFKTSTGKQAGLPVDLKYTQDELNLDYLPENTQGVIAQPIGKRAHLAAMPSQFTPSKMKPDCWNC